MEHETLRFLGYNEGYSLGDFCVLAFDVDVRGFNNSYHLRVCLRAPNVVKGASPATATVVFTSSLTDCPPGYLDVVVKRLIMNALEHEVDEWLTKDGLRLKDPHAETSDDEKVREAHRVAQDPADPSLARPGPE